jgi:hypothetical protein
MLKKRSSVLKRSSLVVLAVLAISLVGGGIVRASADQSNRHANLKTPVWEEVNRTIALNPNKPAPPEVVSRLVSLKVAYKDFRGKQREGIIEVNRDLKDDTITFFKYAYHLNFPFNEVNVSSDPRFTWDDNAMMAANVTSGFNYRTIAGTDRPSQHGLGRAIDVNPRQNPYITLDDQGTPVVAPNGAQWLIGTPGTLHRDHPLLQLMQSRGWAWGGLWTLQDTDGAVIDYQHLQKRAPATASATELSDKESVN